MQLKEYQAKHITEILDISKGSTQIPWEKAEVLTDFCNPWDTKRKFDTTFRALHDQKHFFFRFEVKDDSIYIDEKSDDYESIGASDRMELFFRKDSSLAPYYCMEIDPKARVMDFKAWPNKDFDFDWGFPQEHLQVKSQIIDEGYWVEGTISLDVLKDLHLLKNDSLETGIFRAKFVKFEDKSYKPVWITWVNPETKTPDFHTASSFGLVKLES